MIFARSLFIGAFGAGARVTSGRRPMPSRPCGQAVRDSAPLASCTFMVVSTLILSPFRSPPETMEDPEETWLRLLLTKPADQCSETTEPHRRSACADGHNPIMGRPGFCDRPLHVASGIERGRAMGNCPPPPWLPEGRCEPLPSPAAQTKWCRLMPKPSGSSSGIPHRVWLTPRTRAS